MRERMQNKIKKFPVRKINRKIRKKLVGLFFLVILALVALAIRITYINVSSGEEYSRIVLQSNQQQYVNKTIAFKRGDILDRNGNILATSERVYNLILDCSVVNYEVKDSNGNTSQPYVEPTVNALVKFFKLDEDELYELLTADKTKNSQYKILLKNVTMEEKESFEEYTDLSDEETVKSYSEEEYDARYYVNGVWFEDSYLRLYPQESLACDLIGFTNSSNEASWGIEGYYNDVLNGTNGRTFGYSNSDLNVEQTIISPVDGDNVISTCDINIQEIVRGAIAEYVETYGKEEENYIGAENIAVLVMDPDTGEILAMDSSDWYDLNNPRDLTPFVNEKELKTMNEDEQLELLNSIWRNFCISDSYEPGSTFKPVTVAAALETASVTADDEFYCDGLEVVNGQTIKCNVYPSGHESLTVSTALVNSCNDALMQIASKLGSENFIRYQRSFNFGLKTGIDLPGESSGILYNENTIGPVELATNSFGQGFTCTMVQEAAAICSIINGGYYYKPHVVKSITDSEGNLVEEIEPVLENRTVSESTCELIKEALEATVDGGTAEKARIEGYSIGGKTGTAQKLPRSAKTYLVSFIGFAPVDDPEVLVYVIVDEPRDGPDSKFAQEIAKDIFTELLPYMNIYPESETEEENDTDETEENTETGNDNEAMAEPPEEDVDDTVLYGGNDLYTEGVANDSV